MERIKHLEEQLATKNEVKLSYLIILYVIDVYSAHCFYSYYRLKLNREVVGTSSVKKRGRKTKRKIFPSDNEETESEDSCTYSHIDYHAGYKIEDDKRYWREGAELFGTKCADCGKTISEKETCECIVPSHSYPIHICLGRNKYNCHHCYCDSCYQKKANIETRNTRRSSRRR